MAKVTQAILTRCRKIHVSRELIVFEVILFVKNKQLRYPLLKNRTKPLTSDVLKDHIVSTMHIL